MWTSGGRPVCVWNGIFMVEDLFEGKQCYARRSLQPFSEIMLLKPTGVRTHSACASHCILVKTVYLIFSVAGLHVLLSQIATDPAYPAQFFFFFFFFACGAVSRLCTIRSFSDSLEKVRTRPSRSLFLGLSGAHPLHILACSLGRPFTLH